MYRIREIFYTLQGEGVRAGEPSVFVRFSGCNVGCRAEIVGFDCDTDHLSTVHDMSADAIVNSINDIRGDCNWVVLTGGEPSLQVDPILISRLKHEGYLLAIETNGSRALPPGLDWITVSPKRGMVVFQRVASEVKVVLAAGDKIPMLDVTARYRLLSPAFEGDELPQKNLEHCIDLCLANPSWRLSVQQHKLWKVR